MLGNEGIESVLFIDCDQEVNAPTPSVSHLQSLFLNNIIDMLFCLILV